MSNEKVVALLESERKKQKKSELNERYKILYHYKLGESIYFKEGDNIEDYPFRDATGKPYGYFCDISEEDYQEVKRLYEKELSPDSSPLNAAEKTLSTFGGIILGLGIVAFLILLVAAFNEESWTLFFIGFGIFIVNMLEWASIRVFVNISLKLDKLNLLKKR